LRLLRAEPLAEGAGGDVAIARLAELLSERTWLRRPDRPGLGAAEEFRASKYEPSCSPNWRLSRQNPNLG
jgi:hypothetical protein